MIGLANLTKLSFSEEAYITCSRYLRGKAYFSRNLNLSRDCLIGEFCGETSLTGENLFLKMSILFSSISLLGNEFILISIFALFSSISASFAYYFSTLIVFSAIYFRYHCTLTTYFSMFFPRVAVISSYLFCSAHFKIFSYFFLKSPYLSLILPR